MRAGPVEAGPDRRPIDARNPRTLPQGLMETGANRRDAAPGSGKLSGHTRRFISVDRSDTRLSEIQAATPVMMPCATVHASTESASADATFPDSIRAGMIFSVGMIL
ncbi:hypothetical protein ASF57_14255 [Methylobacterium sp. Leaf117]|nr:hypothetical protein ASF57_14255 [Methylobacterium sp. Leaf117]